MTPQLITCSTGGDQFSLWERVSGLIYHRARIKQSSLSRFSWVHHMLYLLWRCYIHSTLVMSWLVLGQGCVFDETCGEEHGSSHQPFGLFPPCYLCLFCHLCSSIMLTVSLWHICHSRTISDDAQEAFFSFVKFSALNWLLFFLFVLRFDAAWPIPHCSVLSHAVSTFASFTSEMHFCSKVRGNWIHKKEIPHRRACEMATCYI